MSVNVKDFGAIGDGLTLDHQACRAALLSGARDVYFPEGTYLVRNLPVPSFTRIRGDGAGTVIKFDAQHVGYDDLPIDARKSRLSVFYNADVADVGGPFFNSDITIQDLAIDCRAAQINLQRFRAPGELDDLQSHNRVGHGISMVGVDRCAVRRVTVCNAFRDGIYGGRNSAIRTDHFTVADCWIENSGRNAMSFTAGDFPSIADCILLADGRGHDWFGRLSPAPVGITADDCGFDAGMLDFEPNPGAEVRYGSVRNVRCLRPSYAALSIADGASHISVAQSYFQRPQLVNGADCTFTNLAVRGNHVSLSDCDIEGVLRANGNRHYALHVAGAENVSVRGCTLWGADHLGDSPTGGSFRTIAIYGVRYPRFAGNLIYAGTADDQELIRVDDVGGVCEGGRIGPNRWAYRPAEIGFRSAGVAVAPQIFRV